MNSPLLAAERQRLGTPIVRLARSISPNEIHLHSFFLLLNFHLNHQVVKYFFKLDYTFNFHNLSQSLMFVFSARNQRLVSDVNNNNCMSIRGTDLVVRKVLAYATGCGKCLKATREFSRRSVRFIYPKSVSKRRPPQRARKRALASCYSATCK